MSAAALLSELRRRDIQLRAEGSELRCSAPTGALTPELREQLRAYKADLLALIASAQALAGQPRAIVPLQRHGSRTPVFAVAGHNGDVFCYRGLAQCLGEGHPFYGLQPPGLDGESAPLTRVEDLAAYFAAQIRAFQPEALCVVIAGFCAGGAVALELAQQLLASGVEVQLLALFGSPHPTYFSRRRQLWRQLAEQAERIPKHMRALRSRSWAGWRAYAAAELRERAERIAGERAAATDPVLMLRANVERATLRAVRRYRPRPYAGRLALFVPGRRWPFAQALRRWGALAANVERYQGPVDSTGADMLRAPHAAAFAGLFRSCYGRVVVGGSKEPG